MQAIGMITTAFVCGIGDTLLNGWALSVLWAWFIEGLFGLPSLSLGNAIGLSMVVTFATYQYVEVEHKEKKLEDRVATVLYLCLLRPLLSVFSGWIIHQVFF